MNATASPTSLVPTGCYLIRFRPDLPDPDIAYFEGTIRIIRNPNGELRAAGDLYCMRTRDLAGGTAPSETEFLKLSSSAQNQIPVSARENYRAYLKVNSLLENTPGKGQITVCFEVHYFDPRAQRWPQPGTRMMILSPAGKSTRAQNYWEYGGNVIDDETGRKVGVATVRFLSKSLRKARVLLHMVPKVKPPNSSYIKKIFEDLPWDISVEESKTLSGNLPPSDRPWTIAELHEVLQKVSGAAAEPDGPDAKLDHEWLYHLLCVPTIEGEFRGVMFDTYGGDSNNIPREAAAIAGHQKFANDDIWEALKETLLHDEENLYARVALHELGHAMGLDHNHRDNGIMNTTDVIAENAHQSARKILTEANQKAWEQLLGAIQADGTVDHKQLKEMKKSRDETVEGVEKFPRNVKLTFHPDDVERLQLGPDIAVRPGTVYESGGPFFADSAPVRVEDLVLEVVPLLQSVPLGAPVRVGLRLRNTSGINLQVPNDLSLSSGVVSGTVTDPHGEIRTFWPLKRNIDSEKDQDLAPGATSGTASMTLLRGAQGPLFAADGSHRIVVMVAWEQNGTRFFVEGEANVQVSPAVDDVHRALARGLLDSPDSLLNLALGLPVPKDPSHVIHAACRHPVLKPHFAVILARQYATPHFGEDADIKAACEKIDESTVLSAGEIWRLATLLAQSKSQPVRNVFEILKTKVATLLSLRRIVPRDAVELNKILN